MDPIDHVGGSGYYRPREGKRKKSEKPKWKPSIFSSRLEEAELTEAEKADAGLNASAIDSHAPVEQMLDEVHSLGERLKGNPTITEIREYKKAVRSFMRYVLARSFEVEQKRSSLNPLKAKKHTLVRVIDKKLDELAEGILQNQRRQLDLLKKIEEIYGLLVDLVT
ncbi:MAG: YaaR family protein [Spirochaetales bacterium]|nr:YaaR family protein [Spirochaetales bacterium]MCF7938627.1 YaaR family protein [Spirochaetales bacterium]